jgi:hypothetical protein
MFFDLLTTLLFHVKIQPLTRIQIRIRIDLAPWILIWIRIEIKTWTRIHNTEKNNGSLIQVSNIRKKDQG